MKISIEVREADSDGKRAIRLVYYGGSYTDPETGKPQGCYLSSVYLGCRHVCGTPALLRGSKLSEKGTR